MIGTKSWRQLGHWCNAKRHHWFVVNEEGRTVCEDCGVDKRDAKPFPANRGAS